MNTHFRIIVAYFAIRKDNLKAREYKLMTRFTPILLVLVYLISCQAVGTAQFTTTITIPENDPNIGDSESVGSDTQINLNDGGSIGESFHAGDSDGTSQNIEVNVFGGVVGDNFRAYQGSTVNVHGGEFTGSIQGIGSDTNVYGGAC